METHGSFAPETVEAARERYAELGSSAQVVVREVARAMAFDGDEYRERVDGDVVETARDALFASMLAVHVADCDAFDRWIDDHDRFDRDDVERLGSEHVDRVVWHPVPFAGVVVAATFHEERDAAVGTLRRNAFGRVYRERLREE